jgi:hypothetical protein
MLLLEGYILNFTCARYYEYFLFKPSSCGPWNVSSGEFSDAVHSFKMRLLTHYLMQVVRHTSCLIFVFSVASF